MSALPTTAEPKDWILTRSGKHIRPLNPDPDDIVLEDICWALSYEYRFNGHARRGISVGEHSVLVSFFIHRDYGHDALLHDGSEAYLKDIPRPVKHSETFGGYRRAEARIQALIYAKFDTITGLGCRWGLLKQGESHAAVRAADGLSLASEAAHLLGPVSKEWAGSMGRDLMARSAHVHRLTMPVIGLPPFLTRWLWRRRWAECEWKNRRNIQWSKVVYFTTYYILRGLGVIGAPDYTNLKPGP